MDLCCIGRITKAHGVAGGVGIESYSDIPGRFSHVRVVFLGENPEQTTPMTVTRVQESTARTILTLEGVGDRNHAEILVGKYIYIPSDQMMPPPEGMYFIHDLIGCSVRTADGGPVGVLTDVLHLPSHDIYVVNKEGREVLVPAVPEFIASVDIQQKAVVVNTISGLLDDAD